MSTCATVTFANLVSIEDWMTFAAERDIRYSQNTVGQSTFYGGGAEIRLGNKGTVRELADGRIDWATARPPEFFPKVVLTFLHGADLGMFCDTIRAVYATFPGVSVTRDVELDSFLVDLPLTQGIEKHDDLLPTDMVEGWAFAADGYEAPVQSGNARIARDGELWSLHIDGILRAKTRELNDAFAFAGRCDWSWWHGEMPEQKQKQAALPRR